jgi:hypothetical protein
MPTECNADLFGFAPVGRRDVVGSFDGGAMTSDAGALLLGQTDRAIGLTRRLAACFQDHRDQEKMLPMSSVRSVTHVPGCANAAANGKILESLLTPDFLHSLFLRG